ncbi:tyrosine-protein phosphatase Lar-like, partial [Diaphorina citri]|uniref:Tyrosine-protein phosphatase Lar-like n=1 Tax=Diaphorina citri TaxID=121845 RepID=A0A3Q0IVS7_DIACI
MVSLADKIPPGFPQITEAPSTKVVEISHTTVLHCSASGNPPPKISWIREMLPVDTSRNPRYNLLTSGAPGTYIKIKPNLFSPLSVYSADKIPPGFPQITEAPSTKVVEISHTTVLHCSASGNPPPKISWIREMLPVDTSRNPRYNLLTSGAPGALQITNSIEEDQGKYECVAENEVGTEYSPSTMLYVKGKKRCSRSRNGCPSPVLSSNDLR